MIEELVARSQADKTRHFRISNSRSSGRNMTQQSNSIQQVKNPDKQVLESFYNTTVEHVNLRTKREIGKHSLIKRITGKQLVQELMESQHEMKGGFQSEQEKLNKLKEEVKALPDILKPNPNPRTYNMLLEQKKMRRAQHIQELQAFEGEAARVRGGSQARIEDLKNDIETFMKNTQLEIDQYYSSLTDEAFGLREDDVVPEVWNFQANKGRMLRSKLDNVDHQLDQFEDEFLKDIESTVDGLKFTLIDIAFKLEPEVNQIIKEIRETFEKDIEEGKEKNREYYEALKARVEEIAADIARQSTDKEIRWRIIKHGQVVNRYQIQILEQQYQDPQDRKEAISSLDAYLKSVVHKRSSMIGELYSIPAAELTPAKVQKFSEEIALFDEQVQAAFDEFISRLMALKEQCMKRIDDLILNTKEGIEHYNADLNLAAPQTPTREQLFEALFKEDHTSLNKNHADLLQEILNFMESRDKISNDLSVRVGKNLNSFAVRLQKFSSDQSDAKTKYELEKAKLEDENNERLENLSQALDDAKTRLRQAKDHGELDIRLEECFRAVDNIEAEFRDYHEQNKVVIEKHLPFIEEVFAMLENDLLNLISFFPEDKRAELELLYDKVAKYKAKLKTDAFVRERDEREARELEDMLEKNKDNKKFKPPKPKVLDAKKAAIEWQELFNKFYAEGKRPIKEVLQSGASQKRLMNKSIRAYCVGLFQPVEPELTDEEKKQIELANQLKEKEELERKLKEEEEAKKRKGPAPKPAKGKEEEAPIEVANDPEDIEMPHISSSNPMYPDGHHLFSSDYLIHLDAMINLEIAFRAELFDYLARLKAMRVTEAATEDSAFIEMSLLLLDERLRRYYSMKGKIQTDIYSIRSGEITDHKSKYQKQVKSCLDTMDSQTEKFNHLYKTLFEQKEEHTKSVDMAVQSLPLQTSLAAINGVQNAAKEKDFKFGELINQIETSMNELAGPALDALLAANEDYLKTKKLLGDTKSGEFSQQEIDWYRTMFAEISAKIEDHKAKRKEIVKSITDLSRKRKEEALKKFSEAYDIALDELAARNASGKVFGKPKRVAQDIVRTELSHCIRADDTLNKMVDELESLSKNWSSKSAKDLQTFWSDVRFRAMSLRNCIFFFGRYLAAFIDKSPLEEMPRVTYVEDTLDIRSKDFEKKEDEERKIKELSPLEQIYFRGDKVRFIDKIKEMEVSVLQEVSKLYIQQYARFLGPDKTTDVLRTFVQGLRKEMEEFRITYIRRLRAITERIFELAPEVNKAVFGSLNKRFKLSLSSKVQTVEERWQEVQTSSDSKKDQNLKALRPHMNHPFNLLELKKLTSDEDGRFKLVGSELSVRTGSLKTICFETFNEYFQKFLNNFYFFCLLYDNLELPEDFLKLPGDEEVEKPHLSLKKLMVMQQKGELKDTSSLRSIIKKWKTFPLELFSLVGVPNYDFQGLAPVDPKAAAKKATQAPAAAKPKDPKSLKDPKKATAIQAPTTEQEVGRTPGVSSYKNPLTKSAHSSMQQHIDDMVQQYASQLAQSEEYTKKVNDAEFKHKFNWDNQYGAVMNNE